MLKTKGCLEGGFFLEVSYTRSSFRTYLYDIRFIILFYVIGDWASTFYALPLGKEYNPVPAMILENYGIYHLLLIKIAFIFLLFYVAPIIKTSNGRWELTKHIIEFIGVLVTVNNFMVVWYGISLIETLGLV